ncbi:MAG: F0F1 ATP synthase subunit B [Planctomycetes bacterium]|nr:F0F1 ATP synthase subunit B [Planctomycetota bacterium]
MRKWLLALAIVALPLFAARPVLVFAEHAEAEPGAHVAEHEGGEAAAEHGAHAEHPPGYYDEHGGWVRVVLFQLIAFVLLFVALKKWAFPALAGMLKERADKIRDTYAKLEKEKEELARLTKLAQDKLAGIENEAKAKVEAAVREGTAQKAAILSEATSSAARILAKAKSEIDMERAKAIEEIRQEMVRLSLEAAERLVRQQLTNSKQDELFDRFVSELEKVKS